MHNMDDSWSNGNLYEKFMGRWGRLVGRKFLEWLNIPPGCIWLDVGCGTGSLTKLILETNQPKKIISIDSSKEFIAFARQSITNPKAGFQVGLAQSLQLESNSFDVVVSGLMLNFVPQPELAIMEMIRVAKPGAVIGIFVWDYAQGMEMLRYFWDAAVELDRKAEQYDEGIRFPICKRETLASVVTKTGLKQVVVFPIEVKTVFQNFDDYWIPFLENVGHAPVYNMGLSQNDRQ